MATSPKAASVELRMIEPPQSDLEPEVLLAPFEQIENPEKVFKIKYLWITPEQADDMVRKASEEDPEFQQRPLVTAQVRRWRTAIRIGRFVNYLPNGPLCFDPDGKLLNGKHRLTAVAGGENAVGFIAFYNVPRWFYKFMDTGLTRSLKQTLLMGKRPVKGQSTSVMRLAMRYEEFLRGMRRPTGWRSWNQQADEHVDVDEFYDRREEMLDWYESAGKVARGSKLTHASLVVFRWYQQLAWPEGDAKLNEFWDGLATGLDSKGNELRGGSPAMTLRDWSLTSYNMGERIQGKRELHLMLLFMMFDRFCMKARVPQVIWAYGMSMAMPFHPDGFEVGFDNVMAALNELDKDAAKAQVG